MILTHTIWQNCLAGREIEMINENAISNLLIDVDYLEDALKRIGRPHLATVFFELRSVSGIYSRAPNLPNLIRLHLSLSIMLYRSFSSRQTDNYHSLQSNRNDYRPYSRNWPSLDYTSAILLQENQGNEDVGKQKQLVDYTLRNVRDTCSLTLY